MSEPIFDAEAFLPVQQQAMLDELNASPRYMPPEPAFLTAEEWRVRFFTAKANAQRRSYTCAEEDTISPEALEELQGIMRAIDRSTRAAKLAGAFARLADAMDDTNQPVFLSDLRYL